MQLLEPLADTSPVARQIEKSGGTGGLVHVAYRVRDAQAAFEALQAQGQRVIDAAPRPGSRGTTVFFVHPKPAHAAAGLGCLRGDRATGRAAAAAMADTPVFDRLPLQLAAIFPAVPAEAWTAAIRRDLGDAASAGRERAGVGHRRRHPHPAVRPARGSRHAAARAADASALRVARAGQL